MQYFLFLHQVDQELYCDPCKEIETTIVSRDRVSVEVVTVKNWESNIDEWSSYISQPIKKYESPKIANFFACIYG